LRAKENASPARWTAVDRVSRRDRVVAFSFLLVFFALVIGYSFTRAPWWDEGLFADVAVSFRRFGRLGSSVLAPHSYLFLPGIERYTYWQFPLYLVSLGSWFRVAPIAVQSMRLFSVLWSCVYLAGWFLFTRALTRDERLSLFVTVVVVFDYSCVSSASNGRMEMMCAALGQAALATYVCLRERDRKAAFLTAGFFGASSFFCHPMGAVTNALLAVLIISDWRLVSFLDLLRLTIPYFFGGALCFCYVLQAPQIFLAQTKAASGYRVGGPALLLKNVANDIYTRYFTFYFGHLSGPDRLKACTLLFGLVGLIAVAFNRRLRSASYGRLLLVFSGVAYVGVACVDDMKFPYYLVYVTPLFSACGAFWVYDSFGRDGKPFQRLIAGMLLIASVGATIGAFARAIYRNDLANVYKPAVATIRRALNPKEYVIGPSQLAFAFGFGPPLVDDCYLGYASGIKPEVYVMHDSCGPPPVGSERPWDWSRMILATRYQLVFENQMYKVFFRKDVP
jgi:hypothetical protein